ncbi:PREDICTED: F-box/kelch-repeat protein At1g23390 [Nelumbo nucifera]|uniref:F-box/kelch-repeat protein At1g23390 n=2 Tax=Nelumbo nucifera TaxID=4432 RepID=A0A1U7ZEU6_NELNU|nr:PREDICTED: F-box/kelch-repeat protein At1g23390 [Nelumbo nucifera]DAD34539.1 TPA_asm: hypothetical protein HUJ06_005179 [Nelumbo nucifera]
MDLGLIKTLPPPQTFYLLRSSSQPHPNLLYILSSSIFAFSLDALNVTWHNPETPLVWRVDPLVAIIGSHVVVAGGTSAFEDDPPAVEMYNLDSRKWEMCRSMPAILVGSAPTTCLSIAVSKGQLFVLEKLSGVICTFDPEKKTWGGPFNLHRPGPSVLCSLITGSSDGRLILVGLMMGEVTDSIQGIGLWEVNCETSDCKAMGNMPG